VVLPIGDAPNPRGIPFVTYALIAANAAVYVLVTLPLSAVRPHPGDPQVVEYLRAVTDALGGRVPMAELARQVTGYDLFVFAHGFRPADPSIEALFASMFLHGGLVHLAGNMLFLWIYGDNVERRLGMARYLLTYFGTGAAATLAHWASAPGSALPVVGASGAISGVLGCYFVWFPRNVVRLLWLFPPFIGQVFEVPARVVLGVYLVSDNLLPYLLSGTDGGVAHGAHLGGFVAGVAIAWLAERRGAAAQGAGRFDGAAAAGDDLGAAIDLGRFAEAARAYLAQPAQATRRRLTPEQAVALATWLRRAGHPESALVVLRRLVRETTDERSLARAHLALALVELEDLDQPTPAYQHLLAVLDLDADPETVAAARDALGAIARRQKRSLGWNPTR
jgi:membrane associated rhomboid family serine protease